MFTNPESRKNKDGYTEIKVGDKWILLHRLIYEEHHGHIPEGHHINHIDGNKLNNDIRNLQDLSAADHGRVTHLKELSKTEKTCKKCKRRLPIENFRKGRFILARCKNCRFEYAIEKLGYDPRIPGAKEAAFVELEKEDLQAMREIDELRSRDKVPNEQRSV